MLVFYDNCEILNILGCLERSQKFLCDLLFFRLFARFLSEHVYLMVMWLAKSYLYIYGTLHWLITVIHKSMVITLHRYIKERVTGMGLEDDECINEVWK